MVESQEYSAQPRAFFGRNSHIPACTECRARKAKCSKERPSCYHCRSLNKACVYPPKPTRPPLTREHLTAVEDRLSTLETAMQKLFPDGQMEAIIRSLLTNSPATELSENSVAQDAPAAVTRQSDTTVGGVLQHDGDLDIPDLLDSFLPEEDFTMNSNSKSSISHLSSSLPSDPSSASNEEAYIRSYFSTYHLLYPFIHEESFMSQYRGISLTTHRTAWATLSSMVVAMGAWSTGEDTCDIDMIYFEKAKACLKQISVLDKGNVTLLQALLLLSAYNEKRGNPKESWNFLGLAVRMSIGLGFHTESTYTGSSQSLLDKEIQRRVWWSVYCTDSCSSKIHGLPLLLPEDRLITVRPVLNLSDEALTVQTTTHPPETEDLTIYTSLIQQASYHRLANRIYRRLLSVDQISAQEIKSLEDMIDNWHVNSFRYSLPFNSKKLPEWIILARDRQLLCDQSLRLLVHRPALLRLLDKRSISTSMEGVSEDGRLGERQCRVNALHTARTTIKIVANLISEGRFSKITLSFILYALFHAVLVPVIHLRVDPSLPDSISWQRDVEETREILAQLSLGNDALSCHFLVILNQICSSTIVREHHETKEHGMQEHEISPSFPRMVNPTDLRASSNDIFGNQELRFIDAISSKDQPAVTFSEWMHVNQ